MWFDMKTVYFDHAATTHLYPEVASRLVSTHSECLKPFI